IHWGDGFVSTASAAAGTIVPCVNNAGGFDILGSHTYQKVGPLLSPGRVDVMKWTAGTTPATATRLSSGGPSGGAYQRGTQSLITSIQVAHLSQLVATNGVYDPSVSGPLSSLTYSFDFRTFSGNSASEQVGVGLLVKQGENYYVSGYQSVGQTGWQTGSTTSASSFFMVYGSGPAVPDFSAAGAPLGFGYYTADSSTALDTLTWGIANFTVTLNGTTYSDSTFNNGDWMHIVLTSDNLGGPTTSKFTANIDRIPVTYTVDAPVTLTLQSLTPTAGVPLTNVTVGTFTDADPNADINSFRAEIRWGDGFITTASAAEG